MTEEEMLITWTACDTSPQDTLANFRRMKTDRKWRLFAVACCRRIEHLLPDKRSRRSIELAEKHADDAITDAALIEARKEAEKAYDHIGKVRSKARQSLLCAATAAIWCSMMPDKHGVVEVACQCAFNSHQATEKPTAEVYEQAYLLQDVFGGKNPAVKFEPAWRTSTVVALANGIYEERAFDRMPILADAMEEAGCENNRILTHCRDAKGRHTRGCWVVDKILDNK